MKAIQVLEPGQLHITETNEPKKPEGKEVRVKVKRMGICGSDMHILHGENPFATYPRIIGHEVAGEVEEIGSDVSSVAAGDKVVLEPIAYCGECYACRNRRPNVCESIKVYGVHLDGGSQEYINVPEEALHRVNPDLDWSEIVLIEPFTIGAQAIYRGQVQKDDIVFIIGAGPIGLCCLKMAKEAGAKVIISDFNKERLQFAEKWGADVRIHPGEQDVEQTIQDWTNGMGANVVLDAVGTPQTFEQSVKIASTAGCVVLLGFDGTPSSIPQVEITKKELTVCGSRLQTYRFPVVIDLFNTKSFDVKELVSHEFELKDAEKAFQLMEDHPEKVRKVVIKI
ncbi:zinc-binding alcohol dehydrogenase family protein [Alteribacillus bidgolensis]|uniref:L-gulonate 5-dehydrogenase n=1 Tax=Alteribacillus bidgolensis TaxID=930129 RepID=A0A1G8EBL2_9BACI|nr:zinc-binding alcohol dehydrogenase family protein [Alteribacillus bidgolensis]SDH67099.1 L-gulonate 5-dehydrogenase [Alteribacillus bidgolensis]